MDTKQPTQEQIKEFWEWCGFEKDLGLNSLNSQPRKDSEYVGWTYPDGIVYSYLPAIDLNNLFRWAVPKLQMPVILSFYLGETEAILPSHFPDEGTQDEDFMSPPLSVKNENPELALFWAIQEVIHGH